MATNYPGSLDSLPRPTQSTLMDDTGYEGDVVIDNISDAVEAIETELGTDPAGAQATVKARLEYSEKFGPWTGWWVSGGYVNNALSNATQATVTPSANEVRYVPWWCPTGVTVDRIAVEVTTLQSAANARVGIYSPDSTTGGPGALLLDAGEVDCSTTGVKELTVSQALTGGTLYWLAILNESNGVSYRAVGTAAARSVGMVADNTTTTGRVSVYNARTYTSGFETTAVAWASMTTGAVSAPTFWLRRT